MSRFPFAPGAGAKSMSNPVYWTRMHLQNERYKGASTAAVARWNARWLNMQTILNFFVSGWVYPVLVNAELFSDDDIDTGIRLYRESLIEMNKIAEDVETANQNDLNRFMRRLTKFFLHFMHLTIQKNLWDDHEPPLEHVIWSPKDNNFVLLHENFTVEDESSIETRYFLGQPDPGQLSVIQKQFETSKKMLVDTFNMDDPHAFFLSMAIS